MSDTLRMAKKLKAHDIQIPTEYFAETESTFIETESSCQTTIIRYGCR